MRYLWIVTILGIGVGCSTDESGDIQTMDANAQNEFALPDSSLGDEDQTIPDARPDLETGTEPDAEITVSDTQVSVTDVMTTDDGMSVELMDAEVEVPLRTNRGQCIEDSDCPSTGALGASCNRALPGGGCQGCGTNDDCPNGTECSPFGGVCASTCTRDEDCPAGRRCRSSGLCVAQRCADGACPDPRFECSELDLCTRKACAQDDDCHSTMFCASGLCVPQAWQ
ncbi:MAG: hypothetical protein ACPGQS_04710 [Bradymonadia bacterium]